MMHRAAVIAVMCVLVTAASGCGKRTKAYRVHGAVTHGGQPVVRGQIVFVPYGTNHKPGPSGVATIADGRFDTVGSHKPGVAGGPMLVTVNGSLDRAGKRIVFHEFTIDLPESDHEFAIEIPEGNAADAGPEI